MNIAEEVNKVEKENSSLKTKLAKAEGLVENYKQELTQERKKASTLQRRVDEHEGNPLQGQIKSLQAELKEANVNTRVKKLKERTQKLEKQVSTEQSLRMKSENLPDVQKENTKLTAKVEHLETQNATHHRCRTEADKKAAEAEKDKTDAMKMSQVYERELDRLGVDHVQLVKSAGLKL